MSNSILCQQWEVIIDPPQDSSIAINHSDHGKSSD